MKSNLIKELFITIFQAVLPVILGRVVSSEYTLY